MKINFFGSEKFSLSILEKLFESGFEIVSITTKPDAPKGRGKNNAPTVVSDFGIEHGIKVLKPNKLKSEEYIQELKNSNADLAVLCSYGKILPRDVLELFPNGCICIHPSLLPKYRGATPIESALKAGEKETGVSIFYMDEGCDTGDIIIQDKIQVLEDDTRESLREKLAPLASDMTLKAVKSIENGTAPRIKQIDSDASYTKLIKNEDMEINWNTTSEEIKNQIRSIWTEPGARTTFRGKNLIIGPVQIIDEISNLEPGSVVKTIKNKGICIASKNGTILLGDVKPEGKKIMTSWQFACGCQPKTGEILGKVKK